MNAPGVPGRAILVAEDDAITAELIRDRLEREGFAVECVFDGHSAVARAEAGSFDLFIVDLKLPRLDGYRLTERLLGIERYRDAPVIVITGLESKKAVARALDLGAREVVRKPFSPNVLVARAKRHLEESADG